MKRLPLAGSVLAVVLLSASLAYWGLQLFKPPQRAIAAPPPPPPVALNLEAAKGLFGGQISVVAVSNYQLKGVVASQGSGSAAILAIDNKPSLAYGIGREVVPGVTVKEVHPKYVLLSEGGAIKRVDLPSDAGVSSSGISVSGSPSLPGTQPNQVGQPNQAQPNQGIQPNQSGQPNQGGQPPLNQSMPRSMMPGRGPGMQSQPSMQPQPAVQPQPQPAAQEQTPATSQSSPRSSASPTTIAPVPGFDRQQ